MDILPVLDLLNGVVVRGVGGKRNEYRPIESRLVDRADARSVARAFRDEFGLKRLYVADLDAILEGRPNREVWRVLAHEGFELLIDAGFRTVDSARAALASGAMRVITALETWPGPRELAQLCCDQKDNRVIFSLDLRLGRPLGELAPWGTNDPLEIAHQAVAAGIEEMIVLDVAQVGIGAGVTTIPLCQQLRKVFPELRLITGGGVRQTGDLGELATLGIGGVLIASALHDGHVTRTDIERISGRGSRS